MECVRVLFLLVSVLVVPNAAQYKRGQRCRAADSQFGTCVHVSNCRSIYNYVEQHEITPTIKKTLKEYTCNRNSDVCCPPELPDIGGVTDFSHHRNIGLLPTECGMSSPGDKIINGNITALFEYPWAAALKYDVGDKIPYRCGGALINNRYVLTAAHCTRFPITLIGVRLGEHDFDKERDCDTKGRAQICAPPPQDFVISERDIIVHPSYSTTSHQNDIALIRLRKPAQINDGVAPICLPTTLRQQIYKHDNFTVIGWGRTEDKSFSSVLLKVLVPLVSRRTCAPYFSQRTTVTNNHLCAGGRNEQDSCSGDSGGPLSAEFVDDGKVQTTQYGIVSLGPNICGVHGFPTLYTKVDKYLGWILDNIRP